MPNTARAAPVQKITLVGAGLVGSLLALLLSRRGYQVEVLERRSDPRSGAKSAGRSINLALSDRGLLALARAGLDDDIEAVAVPMKQRTMHAKDGALSVQPYGKEGQAIRSVSRGGLNLRLIELCAEEPKIRMAFDRKVVAVDVTAPSVTFEGRDGARTTLETDLVIACDGGFSAVRHELLRRDRFDYQQEYLPHGYKELEIPPGPGGSFLLDQHSLHIWPREDYMLIALPNLDGSFTCTLFMRQGGEGTANFASLSSVDAARAFFAEVFADALALMPSFDADWQANPVSSLHTVRCGPWNVGGTLTLIGDAAHAIVPFYGQGLNCGFEDCRVLLEVLDETKRDGKDDWAAALPLFSARRRPSADAIAALALDNFIEMRDRVADAAFLFRKKVEARLGQLCPERFVPLYTMVTFRPDIPYEEARRRGRVQDIILDRVVALPGIESKLHDDAFAPTLVQAVHDVLRD